VLRTFVRARDKAYPRSTSPAFFLSSRGSRWSPSGFGSSFRKARARAGLDQGHSRALRPHDLRHRFATTRLENWCREGVDVQVRLPLLASKRQSNPWFAGELLLAAQAAGVSSDKR
jgi:site-specific recombinase XerD